ncbi:hypothetical protein ACQEU5_16950 [Marinactinospora thermotolerans]|uniref:Uncharacterized protein n=1 Tax=Marinactinospora thermotolerans DSM 45154 TaxID=1122192 RepID=A0A1T4S0V7_9ACTN|nr:hypothetical protein SAMN02745673_03072 [Marinactinospora thermotolerans DSM 45154]
MTPGNGEESREGRRPVPRPLPGPPGATVGEAGLAERTRTGVRDRLAGLDGLPVAEHVAVFDAIHRDLSAVLSGLDQERPGEPRGDRPGGPRPS